MHKPGLGQRLIERVRGLKAGIYRDDAAKFKIKVTEFALDHRYPPGHMYKWVGDVVVPDSATIIRLAQDLDVSPGWLHYGDEMARKPRRPATARGVIMPQKALPAAASSAIKEKHTKRGISARKHGRGETICQLRGRTMASRLLRPVPTEASGSHRRVA